MPTLSLAMIVKDEANTIGRVLNDARSFCDELIVVDTGSTDQTVNIATQHGATVFHYPWIDDFSAARNYSFDCCNGDWIIWLDADDVIPESEQQKLLELKQTLNDFLDAVSIRYHRIFSPEGECILSTHRHRLIRKSPHLRWKYPIHECVVGIQPEKCLTDERIYIEHRPLEDKQAQKKDRNLKILEKLIRQGERSPRMLYYYANELLDHERYQDAITYYNQYLAVSTGSWERYLAMTHLIRCHLNLNEESEAFAWALKAIEFDSSRAEGFVEAGFYFIRRQEWVKAIPFLTAATAIANRPASGLYPVSHYTWLPYDGLCLCYERLGQYEKAIEMCEKALMFGADTPRLLENLKLLQQALSQN